MSQRASGYERKERDRYETPEWVTEALLPHIQERVKTIWEPACATGKMVSALRKSGRRIIGSDIDGGFDFLTGDALALADAIITNPPYDHSAEFISRALDLMSRRRGVVAMLLRTDYDHAKTRKNLFADHPAFAKKLVLTKRIVWFEPAKASPSFNHAWFIWDWRHQGPPTLAYA